MQNDFVIAVESNALPTNVAPLRVLLVDDETTMHETMGLALRGTDYALVSVTNVYDAMKKITSAYPPDIVITDAMMPGASGFTLITLLKSNPTTSDIPVILWTVLEDLNGGVMDSSGQADITMSKPFDLQNLLASLTKARQLIKTGVEITF